MTIFTRTDLGIEKQCRRCLEFWPNTLEFYYKAGPAATRKTGELLKPICKACVAETRRDRN